MKTIYFIRHGILEGKYQNYSKLNSQEFKSLLLKEIEPNIDEKETEKVLHQLSFIRKCRKIFCSTQKRSIQTAQIISKLCNNIQFTQIDLMNEVEFDESILSQEEAEKGLDFIRMIILSRWFEGKNKETFQDSIERFNKFLKIAKETKEEEIVVVTHGWFMRIIQLSAKGKELNKISFEELLEEKAPPFLDVVKIQIEPQ